LEERSAGQYCPSPGTVYPVLEHMEEHGFVSSEQKGERRIYQLTETGEAMIAAHAEEVAIFWERMSSPPPAQRVEIAFLEEDMELLGRTIWSGVRGILKPDDEETIRGIRAAIELCRNEVRRLITEAGK